ncbi:MAG TPA: CHAT domain-containing protein, partial [Nitrospiraceae bacterium]|nr:CHAT domain-containing protein [Nitrospiraceae bacterium]
MRFPLKRTQSVAVLVTCTVAIILVVAFVRYRIRRRIDPDSADALLQRADDMSWLNSWIEAEPLYRRAEVQFLRKHEPAKALYAHVSEMPALSESSTTIPQQIADLRQDLTLPAAQDRETRLRILTILGMLEVNYDSAMARRTWARVESLALEQHHYLLASRAVGEQGIAAFLLGNIATSKKDVVRAWMVAKVADPAAHIRYASMYGTGLVELHKYKEALGPLNEAIRVAAKTPGAAYPTIAITAKIEALSGLGENNQALTLAASEMKRVSAYHLAGHLYELYQTRADVYERMDQWDHAISDLNRSVGYAKQLSYWRGLTQVDGLLAQAYLHQGALDPALAAIDEAIDANRKIPDELYFVPRDLGIKAQILARLGRTKASNCLYEKSADMLDALLSRVPTPTVERQLLNDLSDVYAGYFISLIHQGKTGDAFRVIERARGRVEAQLLTHHEILAPHQPNEVEIRLTQLNLELLDDDNTSARRHILGAVYSTEQQLGNNPEADFAPPVPVALDKLQNDLHPSELFVEYVLSEPVSYALAVTRTAVHCYSIPARDVLQKEVMQYRSELMAKKTDSALGQRLFDGLLGEIPEFNLKPDLIVVPDGDLNLLPFAALMNGGQYVLSSHVVSVAPSGTAFHLLRHRPARSDQDASLPFLGVAAWTARARPENLLALIRRAVSEPEKRQFVSLPESRYEVQSVADDLPGPDTMLLGSRATETAFKQLPLNRYRVIHLALHGYVDPEFPDRSALVFAPEQPPRDDGLLQIREIRRLPLDASLVTLSACDTGLGPIGEEGVGNIVNAFISSGARSVVFTLWAVED